MSDTQEPQASKPQRVLVVGVGTMGMSHARAYQAIEGFELVGLCTRNAAARSDLDKAFAGVPRFDGLTEALKALKPDAVSIGPKGCVSIVSKEQADTSVKSSDHDNHVRTNALRIHHAGLKADGSFAHADEIESTKDEPGHDELCEREQRLFLKAIRGEVDLSEHLEDAINSLCIVFAADESMRTGQVVKL